MKFFDGNVENVKMNDAPLFLPVKLFNDNIKYILLILDIYW